MRKVTVWGEDECTNCQKVLGQLQALGVSVEEKHISAELHLQPASVRREVMAAIQINDGSLPVVMVGDRAYTPEEAIALAKFGDLA